MKHTLQKLLMTPVHSMSAVALALLVIIGTSTTANADEADAKRLLKAMSDYLAAQKAISFDYDATLEIVTEDNQKLELATSGNVVLHRPNQIRATRSAGFADVETSFDGKTLTLLGKDLNIYAQVDIPGTIDNLINELTMTYNRPLPAGDLLSTDPYKELMDGVINVKDLGSGVVNGIECDYLAFRKDEVDWQIWIAQGESPFPCRYVITSRLINGGPQYSIQARNWKAGDAVAKTDYSFKNSTKATKIELVDIDNADLPRHFILGDDQ